MAQKSALLQREVLEELDSLVKSIDRSEKMITELKAEMEEVNAKHQERKTTRDDIAYLEDLLACAKKKLAWEKLLESLQKRTPILLQKVSQVINDPQNPPADQVRGSILQSLQGVQAAMERLEQAKIS
ncbi:MAG: hypothetical protein EOP84_35005 [Verrucomicrobiaceae bacterium]|nr:MAG: hypothetical protein EOP84_35005 [Verrucomicrobiaceae bacterium]